MDALRWRHLFFFFNPVSPASLSLPPPSCQYAELARGPAPVRKGRGPQEAGRSLACAALSSLGFLRVQTKQQPVEVMTCARNVLCNTPGFFFPFGTPIMSCDVVDQRRSGCSRPVNGPAPLRVRRRFAAPCPASPPSPNCWSPPAGASETSCSPCGSPFDGPACLFCLDSWPGRARCRRRRRGSATPSALCSES